MTDTNETPMADFFLQLDASDALERQKKESLAINQAIYWAAVSETMEYLFCQDQPKGLQNRVDSVVAELASYREFVESQDDTKPANTDE